MPSTLTLALLGVFLLGSIYIFFFNVRRGPRLPPGKYSSACCPDRVDLILKDLRLYPLLGTFINFQKVGYISSMTKSSCTGVIYVCQPE